MGGMPWSCILKHFKACIKRPNCSLLINPYYQQQFYIKRQNCHKMYLSKNNIQKKTYYIEIFLFKEKEYNNKITTIIIIFVFTLFIQHKKSFNNEDNIHESEALKQ